MPKPNEDANPEPDSGGGPGRVRPRQNVVPGVSTGFRKRYEAVGYWTLLAIVMALAIWFVVSSAKNIGNARDAEATVIATLFVPETETAVAEELTETAK